jgi:hypothetical protein
LNKPLTDAQKNAKTRLRASAEKRLKGNQKPLVNAIPSKKSLKQNPKVPTRANAIAALSGDPKNKAIVDKLKTHKPLTKTDKATINTALGNINNISITNNTVNINNNNLAIFNSNTANNFASILAGAAGLAIGAGIGQGSFPQGFMMDSGGVCDGDSVLPSDCPSVFFPNDPGDLEQALSDQGVDDPGDYCTPPVPGVSVAVTPNLPQTYQGDPDMVDPTLTADPTFTATGEGAELGDVAVDDPQGRFNTRYLRVGNETTETIDIFVQYLTFTEQGEKWFPADPAVSEEAISVTLSPGETADITEGDWRINASRIRIWAKSPTQEWSTFKKQDLPLVPETDDTGANTYASNDVQVFNWTVR